MGAACSLQRGSGVFVTVTVQRQRTKEASHCMALCSPEGDTIQTCPNKGHRLSARSVQSFGGCANFPTLSCLLDLECFKLPSSESFTLLNDDKCPDFTDHRQGTESLGKVSTPGSDCCGSSQSGHHPLWDDEKPGNQDTGPEPSCCLRAPEVASRPGLDGSGLAAEPRGIREGLLTREGWDQSHLDLKG